MAQSAENLSRRVQSRRVLDHISTCELNQMALAIRHSELSIPNRVSRIPKHELAIDPSTPCIKWSLYDPITKCYCFLIRSHNASLPLTHNEVDS